MRILHKAMDALGGLLFVSIMLLVLYQVAARYVFNVGVPWIEELSRLIYVHIALVGAAISMRDKQAICIDMIPDLLSERPRRILRACNGIMCFALLLLLFLGCVKMAGKVWPSHFATLDWLSNGWLYVAGIVGFGYMLLNQALSAVRRLVGRAEGGAA